MLVLALLVVGGGVNSVKADSKTPLLLLKNGAINTTDFEITPTGTSTLTTDNLYSATFTTAGDQKNAFQYKSWNVSAYDKVVIKYSITDDSSWGINIPAGGYPPSLPKGADKTYEIDLSGVDTYSDFTVFNWNAGGSTITISEVYLVKTDAPFVTTAGTLGEEITDLKYLTDGGKFVAVSNDGKKVQTYLSSAAGASSTNVESVTSDMYYFLQIAAAPDTLDVNQDGVIDAATYYSIGIYNASGAAKPSNWWGANYICRIGWGDLWSTNFAVNMEGEKLTTNHFGRDNAYSAVWTVEYVDGNGFKFYNPQSNKYMNVSGTQDAVYYLKLYKSIEFTNTTMYPANDEIFALPNATGYNAETGEMTNGTWTFATPVDLSNWKFIIIAMEDGCADASHEISITDNNGQTVKGSQYDGTVAGTGPEMYFSRWNHQNIGAISLDYLKNTKGLDIEQIKSLSIAGTTKPFVVYLSNYESSKLLTTNRYACYKDGDLVRDYVKANVGKFGTVCLPYKASVAGAEVYSITNGGASGISLTKVNGLLEAGKPYFYMACDNIGKDNHGGTPEVNVHNVNFFRADFDKYDVSIPIPDNGLIGTFSATTAPQGSNIYVLSNNKLYDTDATDVNIGANKAYINMSQVPTGGGAARDIMLYFGDADETTGIANVRSQMSDVKAIYNLQGQRVNRLQKGLNIVNGKKVLMK